ncbi:MULTISPECIES: DUF2637 domain-containing protein [Streptomyces]|uniref:DUF2637 domain-containing protein n=1 Tax=Streptomyces griseiscabiei TaxID=2993540 RepID=A0ABU4LJ06_9ACTN|nr:MULTISPECIES: DUF2637 domain-containing protein [Streptomyces]MDX2915709.1 DUF2637 domain-containing protein [Streptomyces griseiscabiei]
MERSEGHIRLNRTQRGLIAVVVAGALVIAAIGFAGSYSAVRELAIRKGFGAFATVFPIGVDAGIAVLLALDLLLTWLRMPFPMLRQAAWLLTAATIGFNAAAAWPDPVGVGMHSVIPILFVVTVEAARHAVGRLAAITADRHMESVRLWRWILSPLPTFKLWRRMMLWEIRKYDDVIHAEQQRLIYQSRLRGRYGRGWRWKAPVEELLPLRIARFGVPLEEPSQPQSRASGVCADSATHELEMSSDSCRLTVKNDASAIRAGHLRGTEPVAGEPILDDVKVERAVGDGSRDEQEDYSPEGEPSSGESSVGAVGARSVATQDPDAQEEVGGDELMPAKHSADRVTKDLGGEMPAGKTGSEPVEPSSGEGPRAGRGEGAPEMGDSGEHRGPASAEHEAAIERLKSNAAAVRYAMTVLGSTHTPTVVDWLAAHGRDVNRGQAHRITKDEEERQLSGRPLTVVEGST